MMTIACEPYTTVQYDNRWTEWNDSSRLQQKKVTYSVGESTAAEMNSSGVDKIYSIGIQYFLLREKVKFFSKMPENWSSFNAPKPSNVAINLAIDALDHLFSGFVAPTTATPTLDGGIKFIFGQSKGTFELEFFNDGDIVFVDNTDGKEDIIDVELKDLKEKISVICNHAAIT
jgi:hypothetical protein